MRFILERYLMLFSHTLCYFLHSFYKAAIWNNLSGGIQIESIINIALSCNEYEVP